MIIFKDCVRVIQLELWQSCQFTTS